MTLLPEVNHKELKVKAFQKYSFAGLLECLIKMDISYKLWTNRLLSLCGILLNIEFYLLPIEELFWRRLKIKKTRILSYNVLKFALDLTTII